MVEIENLIQTPEELSDDEDLEAEYPNSVSNSYFTVHYDDTVTKTVAQNTLNYLSTLRNKSSSLGFNAPINQSGYSTLQSISVTLESFGLKPFELRPNSSTSPQDLEVVIDFSGVRSTTNSVRFVKETASGSIIPFGTDATAVRYSAVINPFGNATSAANNIVDLYVAPINAGSYDRRINITYQLAG